MRRIAWREAWTRQSSHCILREDPDTDVNIVQELDARTYSGSLRLGLVLFLRLRG